MDDLDRTDQDVDINPKGDQNLKVWVLVGIVAVVIFGVLLGVMAHAIQKPPSPQALVAAAFNKLSPVPVKELQLGTGSKPSLSQPIGVPSTGKKWTPMYLCPTHGATVTPTFDGNGVPHCPICNQLMVTNK